MNQNFEAGVQTQKITFDKGIKVGEKIVEGTKFAVWHDGDIPVGGEVVDKCFGAFEKAFDLEQKIFGGEVKETFWEGEEISLILVDGTNVAMNNAFGANTKFVIDSLEDTLKAAMTHEMVEMWREDKGLTGEGVPLMVEYLFCGDDRLEELFNGKLIKNFGKDGYSHQKGWNKVVKYLGFKGDDIEILKNGLLDWKKSLTEEEKIVFIKNKLLNWDQNAKESNDLRN